MTRKQIIHEARKCVGIKFKHQGRSPAGIDCVGLLYAIAAGVGLPTEAVHNYAHRPGCEMLFGELVKYCDERLLAERQAGDIVVVAFPGDEPQHVMIVTDTGTVIHASARDRKVVEHNITPAIENGIMKVFRFRALED